jgi:hypothetical protein
MILRALLNIAHRNDSSRPSLTVTTSIGAFNLTHKEMDLLRSLEARELGSEQANSFYASIVSREQRFPPEWERLVLRANMKAFPGRFDLLERLALVEEMISSGDDEKALARALEFERQWTRFRALSIVSENGEIDGEQQYRAYSLAIALLSSAEFDRRTSREKCAIVESLHNTLMSAPSTRNFLVGDAGMEAFQRMLEDPALTFSEAAKIYDLLHSLFFSGATDVRDLRRFDRINSAYEGWLEARLHVKPRPPLPECGRLNIAYLLHYAHFQRGNAVSPLIMELVEHHARRDGRRVILYAVHHADPDAVRLLTQKGLEVRTFELIAPYDRLEAIERTLRADAIDVVITEQNRAMASALFVSRVAHCQMWVDTGFPFWSLKALDWTISPAMAELANLPPRTSPLIWGQSLENLSRPVDASEVARVRNRFPKDAFVLGVFVRLVKLDRAYLDFLRRLLQSEPRLYLVIAGPGDPTLVQGFASHPEMSGRVDFISGLVDLNVYGRAIDAMCDTFPFVGGNACREVSVHGKPVVSKLGTPWDGLLLADRNPDLLAADEDDYIRLVRRLALEAEFYQNQCRLAKAKALAGPAMMIDQVEEAIANCISDIASRMHHIG